MAREFADFERALDSFGPPRGVITRRKLGEVPVDIILFGPIARGGHLEHGDSHWELRGLQEAYDSAELCIIGDSSVKIPQIYAMMSLKIIVWGERAFPTDCTDFHHLLVASCKILDESGELWESPLWEDEDVIEQCEGNPELLAAYSAGRKLAVLFAGVALERCIEILADPGNREVFVITALRDYRDPRTNSNYKKMYEVFFLGIRTI